jgi:hypothetical protein
VGAIQVANGYLVDPFDIQPQDVTFSVAAHSLSQINRFTGHARHPYSVAQHTLALYELVPQTAKAAALIHDFPENWFNDLASPVKRTFPEYRAKEKEAMKAVVTVTGVSKHHLDMVDQYDKAIYINERDYLFPRVYGEGMNDAIRGLDIDAALADRLFGEQNWRTVRNRLNALFALYFPWAYVGIREIDYEDFYGDGG